ncbi:MAG: hypothetical protein ACC726_06140 [Chloroflexota bacterium]
MSPTRSRITGVAVSAALLLSSLGAAAPVAAADSPEHAVDELFDMAVMGDFSRLDEVVCAAERDGVRELFGLGEQLGLDGEASFLDALSTQIENRSVQLLGEDRDTATLQVTADVSVNIEEDQIEGLARAILEADRGPDDPPVGDDQIDMMVGFMGSSFDQSRPLDEEFTVVREDGQWLVCGGLVDEPQEPLSGFEPSVSTEGLCELVTPAELSAVSALEFDTSSGFETFCTYFTADLDTFYSILVTLWLNGDAESVAAFYEADQPLEVAAAAAYAGGAEGFTQQLFTQAGEDVLQVTLALDDDASESVDWLAQAILVTELFLPHLADFRFELVGPAPAPTPEPTPEVSLCESLPLAGINSATGLGFDDASGNSDYCSYSSIDGDPGYHGITVSLAPLSLDGYRTFMTDVKDTTVAGLPAIAGMSQLIIELPGGAWTLHVTAFLDPSDEATTLTGEEVMATVAELLLPNISVPDPEPLEVPSEDPAAVSGGQPTLLRPLCEYIDLNAVNAIGVASYDTVADIGPDFCSLSQSDLGAGISQLMVYVEPLAIDELRSFYPGGTDVTIAGRPGYEKDAVLWVQTDAGLISIQAFLPDDASGEGIDPGEITIPVAEMVLAGIEADAQ